MKNFLPEGHETPDLGSSGYFRFKDGENKFRILDSAIVGYELWIGGKPVRRKGNNFTIDELSKADINKFTGKKKEPVYFWIFPVWSYEEKKVQIMETTQVSIITGIESYLNDEEWGIPFSYDLVVVRQSEPKVTYSVKAKPHKELDKDIKILYEDMNIDLTAIYSGKNPFNANLDESEKDLVNDTDKALG